MAKKAPKQSLKPVKDRGLESRRIIFRRATPSGPQAPRADIILGLNRALAKLGLPIFARVIDAGYTTTGAITALLDKGALGQMVVPIYGDALLAAVCQIDRGVVSVELPEQWFRVRIHGVNTQRYRSLGLGLAREEIELGTGLQLKRDPIWLIRQERLANRPWSTIVITVGSLDEARKIISNGLRFGGQRHEATQYWEIGPDSICPRCAGIGHSSYKGCKESPPKCYICAGPHEGLEHACIVTNCQAKIGAACVHLPTKCANCGGGHQALNKACPRQREARKQWRETKDQALR